MAKEQDETRQFLIKHEACSCVMVINTRKLIDSCDPKGKRTSLACPGCGESLIDAHPLAAFFLQYEALSETLAEKNATMCEISSDELARTPLFIDLGKD